MVTTVQNPELSCCGRFEGTCHSVSYEGGTVEFQVWELAIERTQSIPIQKERSTLIIFNSSFSSISTSQAIKKINLGKVKYNFKSLSGENYQKITEIITKFWSWYFLYFSPKIKASTHILKYLTRVIRCNLKRYLLLDVAGTPQALSITERIQRWKKKALNHR